MSKELLSFSNVVFSTYAFYGAAVLVKMFLMALLTTRQRISKGVFSNPEDAKSSKAKIIFNDPDVERVRRNHLNDLENIPAFLLLGFIYVLTDPTPGVAIWHFRIYAVTRVLHTIAYQVPLPQPSRFLAFLPGMAVNLSMAIQIMLMGKF